MNTGQIVEQAREMLILTKEIKVLSYSYIYVMQLIVQQALTVDHAEIL